METNQTGGPIYHEGPSAEVRLNRLGLKQAWLVEAVIAGESERINCSTLEPLCAPGIKAWYATIRVLAEHLVAIPDSDWVKIESLNLPRIVNKKTGVAIAVLSGNDAVGDSRRDPKSKNPRGGQTILLIHSNQQQLNLFEDVRFVPVAPDSELFTWWLLVFSDGAGDLRAELSLPIALGNDARFSVFKERIVIPIPAQERRANLPKDESEPPIEIEVEVKPKG